MTTVLSKIRRQPAWIALFIFIGLCLWVGSGHLTAEPVTSKKASIESPLTKVVVATKYAEQVNREVNLYGRTEPNRSATLRSEVKGTVQHIYADEGSVVTQGQKILALNRNDLDAQLRSARAILKQRELELKGAKSLGQKGFQSEAALAQAQANVELAKSDIARVELALSQTIIVAPFDGVLNQRHVEIGDLLRDGDDIVTVVDLDPMIVSSDVTERWVGQLSIGQAANGRLTTGQQVMGRIRYISSVSNMGTNTFPIEIEVSNEQRALLAGMSTELSIPLQQTWAIKITPAVMALDESGNLGVKTVIQNRVKFTPIDILKSDSDGVWLGGLGEQADVITRGHGFVRDGDEVEVIMEDQIAPEDTRL